jgi:oxygen-independent coproporphyrinogen-3 oxidase
MNETQEFDQEVIRLLHKYNCPVPRYTSYPTAVQFSDNIPDNCYEMLLENIDDNQSLSLYMHIPFCRALCNYCGCFTRVVNHYDPIHDYVSLLCQEIELVGKITGKNKKVSHIHFGGGSPNYLSNEDFIRIMTTISSSFKVSKDAEIAMEMDPRILEQEKIRIYAEAGVNRASFGVQDFDPNVQKAIGREQPYKHVSKCIQWLRDAGIDNINFDLIYGLPNQDENTISDTVSKAISLKPDRVALFGYAHVPWMRKHQLKLEKYDIPDMELRYQLFETAKLSFTEKGYDPVGIDHFVKANDNEKSKLLHRNFQGYTTDNTSILLGFGISSISSFPYSYLQNTTSFREYRKYLLQDKLPISRGIMMNESDRIRGNIIEAIMCRFEVDIEGICSIYSFPTDNLSDAIENMAEYIEDGLVEVTGNIVKITDKGRPFTRLIAACFDEYLSPERNRHSQAV